MADILEVIQEAKVERVKKVRGKDRHKLKGEWKDVEIVYTFEDGGTVGRVTDPDDLATLGKLMGHCSGTHWVWANEERIWQFFVVFDKDGTPRTTIHTKTAEWLNKPHPRDSMPKAPLSNFDTYSGYPTRRNCADSYDPKKHGPPRFNSCTYDIHRTTYNRDHERLSYQIDNAQWNVRDQESYVKNVLERAKECGPLGKDHPHKATVDQARRDLNVYKDQLKALKEQKAALEGKDGQQAVLGRVFDYHGEELVLMSTGYGHERRVLEWISNFPMTGTVRDGKVVRC